MFRRFFIKTRFLLLTLLSLLSLVSVGFASWTITAFDVSKELTGSLESDNVINSINYIEFDEKFGSDGIEYFKYYNTGYINETDDSLTIVGESSIKASFYINLAKFKNEYPDETSLQIVITIKQLSKSDFDLFIPDLIDNNGIKITKHEVTHSVIVNDETENFLSCTGGPTNNKSYDIVIDLNDILVEDIGIIPLTVNFYFKTETGEYFTENVFNVLKDGFSISARLKGSKDTTK